MVIDILNVKGIRQDRSRATKRFLVKKRVFEDFHANRLWLPILPNAFDHYDRVRLWFIIKGKRQGTGKQPGLVKIRERRTERYLGGGVVDISNDVQIGFLF